MPSPLATLLGAVFLLWVVAGFLDWTCHRRTAIAQTSGLHENLLHWLQFLEVGAGVAAVVFLQWNAGLLAVLLGVFVIHEATVYWDLNYSTMRRDVGPFEQMVHSFLELLPLLAILLLISGAWSQALAVVHLGDDVADWKLRPREDLLPMPLLVAGGGAVLLLNVLPLLQETWSCLAERFRAGREPARRVEPHFDPAVKVRTPASPEPR